MALKVARAKKEGGPFRPGTRVIDDTCDRLPVEQVRRLLESPSVLPEHERWTPTRWLMKACYEAVHGKGAALASLVPSLRSAADNENHVVDLYRKLSGDFGSSKDDVHGTGERAHDRANRSYVFSSQLRHWLHENATVLGAVACDDDSGSSELEVRISNAKHGQLLHRLEALGLAAEH